MAERDDDLVLARCAAHAREAVGQHAAPQGFGELALDVARQSATFGGGRAHLGAIAAWRIPSTVTPRL